MPAVKAEVAVRWMEAVVEDRAAVVGPEPRGLSVRVPAGAQLEIAAPGQVKLAVQLLQALADVYARTERSDIAKRRSLCPQGSAGGR